jgi:hypothetical protein
MNEIMLNYETSNPELQDYIPYLNKFMKIEMNQQLTNKQEIAEVLLSIIIGSRNIRQGKAPTIEVQANIIKLIKQCMETGKPIPVLVGSGPKKTDNNSSIDIAELSVLNILECVNNEVKKFHKPGLDIQIRLEDLTGIWLEGDKAVNSMDRYMKDFQKLLRILGYENIKTFRESQLTSLKDFTESSKMYSELFEEYLTETHELDESEYTSTDSYKKLTETGWKGIVPFVMREYLYNKYYKLIPGINKKGMIEVASKYLGSTLARNKLNATGKSAGMYESGFKPMEIAFATPTPGIPEDMHGARVYYRTVTLKNSKKHIPYWRAKGILKINKMGDVRYSLTGWGEDLNQIIPGYYDISNGLEDLRISADTIIED